MDPRLEERDIALWFTPFVSIHQDRFPRSDWPVSVEDRKAFFQPWKSALAKCKATGRLADLASQRLAADPPRHLSDHLPALLKLITVVRRELDSAAGRFHTREESEAASAKCRRCGGAGIATVERQDLGRTVAAYCTCPLGRWFKERHSSAKELRGRFADLAAEPPGSAVEDPQLEAFWAECEDWLREDWRQWARKTRPVLAAHADAAPNSHWPRTLESTAMVSCWEASSDLEVKIPRRRKPVAGEKQTGTALRRVDELDEQQLAEQRRRREEAERWLMDRKPRWKTEEEHSERSGVSDPRPGDEAGPEEILSEPNGSGRSGSGGVD